MKIRSTTLDAIALIVMLFILNIASASAARNEHRPVCSADGSRLIYMMQTKQTNDDWELYMLEIDSQVHSSLTSH